MKMVDRRRRTKNHFFVHSIYTFTLSTKEEARWSSGRASVSRARSRGVRSSLRSPCCVLQQDTFTSHKVIVIPRKQWVRPDITEKKFTGTLNKNETKLSTKRTA